MNPYSGKRVVVVGLASSGMSTAKALLGLGAKVRVTEGSTSVEIEERALELRAAGATVETGAHDLTHLDADLAVVSPGVPPASTVMRTLESTGIEIVSEIEIAYRLSRADLLAVTGTNGKTTTTSLLAGMLSEGGLDTVAAGNIGYPLIDAISSVPPGNAIAVEVSSFQLATTVHFRPKVAVILNVAEDHTDWHGSFGGYAAAKAKIVANQQPEDVFLPNAEDPEATRIADGAVARLVPFSVNRMPDHQPSIGVEDGHIVWRRTRIIPVEDVPLPGVAGLEDTVAAAGAALEYGIDAHSVVRAIRAFRPLPHRLEVVAIADGVTYIDDSKATNPHATLAAVQGLTDVVLIAGGRSKGIDLSALKGTVPPVVGVVALGEAADQVLEVFEGLVPAQRADSMERAVALAREQIGAKGSVLLSPGCASLDMYESYAARGDHFGACVAALLKADQEIE
ncbi:MAG TPA: UDP-N-acetylmuramoyl-L-alanine--D-glutamate ligase [Actinomycetota bacterium]|nr:UDP-N-acetylmuramoyl-L-alanine--D-glutamate ligase [Actinomycetota bacterium]